MSFLKKYIIIVLLFIVVKINAQEYSIKNLNLEDGLPSNIIYDIQQDKIGYLWLATEKGLVKFDGDDFKLINKHKTTTLFIDDKTIYAGLENGLFIKNNTKELLLKSKKVLCVFKFQKDIFIGTIEGIYRLVNNKLQSVNINTSIDSSSINDVYFDENSVIIASSKGLYKFNKELKSSNLKLIKNGNFVTIEKIYDDILVVENSNKISIIKNDTITETITSLNNISAIKK